MAAIGCNYSEIAGARSVNKSDATAAASLSMAFFLFGVVGDEGTKFHGDK